MSTTYYATSDRASCGSKLFLHSGFFFVLKQRKGQVTHFTKQTPHDNILYTAHNNIKTTIHITTYIAIVNQYCTSFIESFNSEKSSIISLMTKDIYTMVQLFAGARFLKSFKLYTWRVLLPSRMIMRSVSLQCSPVWALTSQ